MGRLKTEFSLSLESPSANRLANRELGDVLRLYAKTVSEKAYMDGDNYSELTFRDRRLVDEVIPALCDAIELPCFRVSTLNVRSLKMCFPILEEEKGLAELLENFAGNLGNNFSLLVAHDPDNETYYYVTRWSRDV